MSESVKELKKLRGNCKGKLTLFEKHIKSLPSTITAEQCIDLESRLEKINENFDDFEIHQSKLELCTKFEDQMEEREDFENKYYSCISRGKFLINQFKIENPIPQQEKPKDKDSSSNSESIKFPDITLPSFSGDVTSWLEFRDTFDALINKSNLKPIHKLKYLRSCLTDSALNVIASLEYCEDSYPIAWSLLCERFNNTKVLVTNHLRELLNIDTVPPAPSALRGLVDNISKHLRTLNNLQINTENWDILLIFLISSKLDKSIQRRWEEKTNSRELPKLQDFKSFLRSQADLLESLGSEKSMDQSEQRSNTRKAMVITSSPAPANSNKPTIKSKVYNNHCPNCRETHFINQCPKFLALNASSRIRAVKRLGLCTNCLGSNHILPNCRASHCRSCKGKHHTLLHITPTTNNNNQSNTEQIPISTLHNTLPNTELQQSQSVNLHTSSNVNSANHYQYQHKSVLLSTAQINVLDSNNQMHTLRALLDSGSQSNFITESAFKRLNLPKKQISMEVLGFNDKISKIKHLCNLTIKSKNDSFTTNTSFFIVPLICRLPSHEIEIQRINIPKQYQLADDTFYTGGEIDIILGTEVFYDVLCYGQYRLGPGLPLLQKTRLGWVVSGTLLVSSVPKSVRCNFIQTNNHEFWGVDDSISTKFSDDDLQCEKIFQSHSRSSDGNFVVNIPLKEPVTSLGQSRPAVYKRFKSLETKFERCPDYKEKYVAFMREFEQSGHMVKLNSNESCNYLPHHAVINLQKTTTPLRVVFDASFKTNNGKSLNDIQYKGSVNQDELVNILLRFRKHKYVVSADIEKMYRMIYINPEQHNMQCIFWRDNPSQPLSTYILTTLSFGLKSAPHVATRCLTQLAIENQACYPAAAAAICTDFYMDDFLRSGDDEQEVAQTAVQVRDILKGANFHLRKWKSNSTYITNLLSNNNFHLSPTITTPNILTHETHKILGLHWCCNSDNLTYVFKAEPMPDLLTKRKVLSMASTIFDPIGLLAPVIIIAKKFIQQLWQNKSNWDEKLSTELCEFWQIFYNDLNTLNTLWIPRQPLISGYVSVELHGFADSSLTAYGAVVYLRSIDTYGNILVRVLCAKTRVARKETIPRLELRAAHILANLVYKVKQVLNFEFSSTFLWSDSNIVLAWIQSQLQQNKLKVFVKNRVKDIKKLTNEKDWHWVSSSDNPADILSRGVLAQKIASTRLWWQGPCWLSRPNKEWPLFTIPEPALSEQNLEVICNVCTDNPKNEFINELYSRWSNLEKLKRVFAYVQRFIYNLKNTQNKIISPLTVNELNLSLNKLVTYAQIESFPSEYRALKSNKSILQSSNILCLKPFLDGGLIRVGGRLKNSPYSYDKKHPILLHNKHILTLLIIKSYHIKLLHAGPQLLLATIRERFWPINGKGLVTKVTRECVTCFKAKPQTSIPVMGDLPASRVTPSHPFQTTGVDYAGPFTIRSWRGRGYKTSKCYISLFVCFSTKAIHIELVSGLDTQSFLAALRRFVSRRGKPMQMVSDNGTTFHGANNELVELYQFVRDNFNEIMTSCTNEGIKWSFMPAYTPHMGGLYEASVKSCKYFLKRILGQALLTYEEFTTVLIQVEGILNSRPLCPLYSTDVNDFSVLTPAHFLIGRAVTTLPDYDYKDVPINRLTHFQQLQQLQQDFWRRWSRDYVGILQQRTKWRSSKGPTLAVSTMVLVKDDRLPPCHWRLGRIIQNHDGRDGVTRVATIKTVKGNIRRAFNTICPLPIKI